MQLSLPRVLDIDRGPGRPRYLVDSAYFFKADPEVLNKNTIIHQELHDTKCYAAPEISFGWDVDVYSDIWAIGCLIYEMLSGTPLFHLAIQNLPNEAFYQITDVLGRLPPHWGLAQSNDEGDSGRYGTKIQWTCPLKSLNFHGMY